MSEDINPPQLSDTQVKVFASLSIISGMMSVFGSSMIMYLVVKSPHTTPYKRILFGLSASDVVSSTTMAFQIFMLPQESSQRVWARGNDATCSASGFLTQLAVATVWYNGMLSYYYLATIRFGVKTDAFARRYEPIVHSLSIGYNLITAVVGLGFGFYREVDLGMFCWVANWPEGCEVTKTCSKNRMIGWVYAGGPFVFLFLSILINNFIICRFVKSKMDRVRRSSLRGSVHQKKRISEVATQALLYVGTFTLAYVWTFILQVVESSVPKVDETKIFPLLLLQSIFFPLQGFFNLIVYTRPSYTRFRTRFPNSSRKLALCRAWFGDDFSTTGDQTSNFASRGHVSRLFLGPPRNETNTIQNENNAPLPGDFSQPDLPPLKSDQLDELSDYSDLDNLSIVFEEMQDDDASTDEFDTGLFSTSLFSNLWIRNVICKEESSGVELSNDCCEETNEGTTSIEPLGN